LTLITRHGLDVEEAGKRSQSYDLRVPLKNGAFARAVGVPTGSYEVKSLWRSRPGRAFDPRFKVGRRGESIYYKRDLAIKQFAAALEGEIDSIVENSVKYPIGPTSPNEMLRFVEQTHDFVGRALRRLHSKSFSARLERLALASLTIPTVTQAAQRVLKSQLQASDIVRGFIDVEGIFVVADHMYTLVTRDEFPKFLAFDSFGSEGLKLRYTKTIPRDKTDKVKVEDGV